ncbi:MFS transporter [Oceanicoccus sagamiensis]|uniref:Major facilitator superfamily (MFS) profile domain-containing protein n=1 Tax=Oceanicoccus sagamiensis TaxID=716816 RepID=A0A1X9NKU2_9GAMM|nr:MFS transporter [Oceanicoccus sagamiensis]ARN74573.1 hypothetical protein BST96_10835 [Oceanicoccus sagamiensis]
MKAGFGNVFILAFSNALAFSVTPMMMLVGSLLGADMAPSVDWATLPIALMVIGTAIGVVPATKLMQSLGRKNALWLFMGLGIATCLLASESLVYHSFTLFCVCALFIGVTNAALQQVRFAAMECVDASKAATAASVIMLGGVLAAIVGPELAVFGRHLTEIDYQGSFWLVAASTGLAAILLTFFSPAQQAAVTTASTTRPIREILQNRAFCLAVASGVVGYMVMTFVMTCTPISMHNHHGHSLADTKWVIQCHIAAMFLPSLVSPWLFRLLGIRGMMVTGLICYAITIAIGVVDTSVNGFWLQLVMLGIGWNFLFVSGTALLPSTYLPGEQYRAQSFNDSTVFSIQAVASLSAGWAISSTSWQAVLLLCTIPVGLMLYALLWSRSAKLAVS